MNLTSKPSNVSNEQKFASVENGWHWNVHKIAFIHFRTPDSNLEVDFDSFTVKPTENSLLLRFKTRDK